MPKFCKTIYDVEIALIITFGIEFSNLFSQASFPSRCLRVLIGFNFFFSQDSLGTKKMH